MSTLETPSANTGTKFPHTRSLLASLAKEYGLSAKLTPPKPLSDHSDSESDGKEDALNTDVLVAKIIHLLDDEEEESVKDILRDAFGISDDAALEQGVLDLMHKRNDDLSNVPFLFLTPIKRPSRPVSRANSYRGSRPGTPTTLVPSSPLVGAFRRPSTPLAYPNGTSSPLASPTPVSAVANVFPNGGGSQPGSPHASPRFLNAKATEFRPGLVRSNSSTSILRGGSPDLWAHHAMPSPTLSTVSLSGRTSSNLAIAAPLIAADHGYDSPSEDYPSHHNGVLLLRQDPPRTPYDDDEDPFSPFVVKTPPGQHMNMLGVTPRPPSDVDTQWSASSNSASPPSNPYDNPSGHILTPQDEFGYANPRLQQYARPGFFVRTNSSSSLGLPEEKDASLASGPAASAADADMTPFEVLSSIFGGTVPPSTLEAALLNSGYEFEGAMEWLIAQALPTPGSPHPRPAPSGTITIGRDGYGSRPSVVRNNSGPRYNGQQQQQQQQQQKAGTNGNRVCRYFLAGDCRRADCRFSHDIDRAMCRFWLRGQCAKGDACEFLHRLPQQVDVSAITTAMRRTNVTDDRMNIEPRNDFPTLSQATSTLQGNRPLDPSRTRWSNVVKQNSLQNNMPLSRSRDIAARANMPTNPRPSPRLRLRPPTLVPTLPTGSQLNKLYLSYRARAIELGAARNASLSKASEAWRRGDGAGAKRFSREAASLNTQMAIEAADAAAGLVRERSRVATEAARSRDTAWSDDPSDRTARGRLCGGGLGVVLGIARTSIIPEQRLTPEERTECLLDLHGLHANEAIEVVEDFLLSLEKEQFFGLAYLIVGEEKHTGTQDVSRGSSRARLGAGVRDWLFKFGYPWSERDGIICVDALTHS